MTVVIIVFLFLGAIAGLNWFLYVNADKRYLTAYDDIVSNFCDFLRDINVYNIKDVAWASHIVFQKHKIKGSFMLYENITHESASYIIFDMRKILYRETVMSFDKYKNSLSNKNIELQLALPIFERDVLFTIFDKDGKINDTFIKDLNIEKPFKKIFTHNILNKIGYNVDIESEIDVEDWGW